MTPIRVLIVDDTQSIRSMLSTLLRSQGYEVVAELEDGSHVMDAIRQHKPDIVCLDYQLPGRDGLDLLREINETLPEIDVLFMTASEDGDIEGNAADAGAAGFIRKPFAQSKIINELKLVCDTRQQARTATTPAALPTARPEAGADTAAVATNESAPGTARVLPVIRRKVVIADDNGSIRLLLKGLLASIGFEVVQLVGNGKEAVNAVQQHQPGVLCLDVDMPVMTGFEALPLIRQASPNTVVVMVTGNASRDFVQKAISLGAKGYFIKPIRPANIEAFMKKLLA